MGLLLHKVQQDLMWRRLLLLGCLLSPCIALAPISLRTSVKLQSTPSDVARTFLATPCNWPRIVLSSWAVEGDDTSKPLRKGDVVDEIFGLPPVLPLRVCWTCAESSPNTLDFQSAQGVTGLARNCRMLFEFCQERDDDEDSTTVALTMEYEPINNVLGFLAIPLLSLDNAIAVKVLLPNALQVLQSKQDLSPLAKFRRLMGTLYGVAGLVHAGDCFVGNSQLLRMVGAPGFYDLPFQGQILATTWCVMGPLAFVSSHVGNMKFADAGLIAYGLVEVACAAIVTTFFESGSATAFTNAIVVQAIVAASWVYSSQQIE